MKRPVTSPKQLRPPLLARLLLKLRRLREHHEEVETDLHELFRARLPEKGRWHAATRYWIDVASIWLHRTDRLVVSAPPRRRPFDGLVLDVRFAVRMLRRQIGTTAVTVSGLALAIGISTTVFGAVNAALLQPSGVPNSSSVVTASRIFDSGLSASFAHTDYLRLRESSRLVKLEALLDEGASFGDTDTESVSVTLVSGGFFETLGVRAAIGRVLTDGDNSAASPPTVVVSHTFWRQRLGGDTSILGKTVWLMGTPFVVVGVLEETFIGPNPLYRTPAFWAPLALATQGRVWRPEPAPDLGVHVIGRIAEEATRLQAESEISALAVSLAGERSASRARQVVRVRLEDADRRLTNPSFWWFLAVVAIIISLVLLLAYVNVTNLLLAGAMTRRREVGLRLALGASRARVLRQLLTESLLLSCAGGALGLLCAYWLSPLFASLIQLPSTVDVAPDIRLYGFLAATTLLVGVGAGLAPARYGAHGDVATPLSDNPATAMLTARPSRVRSVLVSVQAFASIILLVPAMLLVRDIAHVRQLDLGFDADRLLAVVPSLAVRGLDPAMAATYWGEALERVVGLPEVERVARAEYPPFFPARGSRYARLESNGRSYMVFFNKTSADYFAVTGIPVLHGRTYTPEEVVTGAPVAVITEDFARNFWGGENALGATLEGIDEDLSDTTVIGIVADAVSNRFEDPEAATLYRPLTPADEMLGGLVIRTRQTAAAAQIPVLETLRALAPEVRPRVVPVHDGMADALQPLRLLAGMATFLGVFAVGLSVTGIFGLTAFAVEQRTSEIGVRRAVGADQGDILRLMLRGSLTSVTVGLVVGLLVALATGRLLASFLYNVSVHDPLAIGGAVSVLLGAAALAAIVPARRAIRADPVAVLRQG